MDPRARHELSVTPTPWVVWGRALLLGSVGFGAGAVSHGLGDGHFPGVGTLTMVWAACVLVCAVFLIGRAGVVRLTLLVLGGQTAVHAALSVLAGHRGEGAPAPATVPLVDGSTTGRPERFHDQYEVLVETLPAGQGHDWLGHQIDHFTAQGPAMIAAHLGGAIVVGLFLAVGENALWRLLLLMAARARVRVCAWQLVLASVCVRRGVALRAGMLSAPHSPAVPSLLLERRVLTHRGPPLVLAA